MRIAIIGGGAMGGATAIGFAKAGIDGITVTARHQATLEKFKPYAGITAILDNKMAVMDADIVILVVKPWLVEGVVKEISPYLDLERQLIVSMTTGVTAEKYLGWLGNKVKLAYVIPNIAIEVGESMTFISDVTAGQVRVDELRSLFDKVGGTMVVEQRNLSAGTALASCGIAYAFRYIRAAAEGGIELGFYAKDATEIVARTVKGAASLLEEHKSHPEAEIDKVTTPGGITIRGLNAMEECGFTNAVIKGLKASK